VPAHFGASSARTRFARFARALLAFDMAVAAWGAYVRATGSGAGCGRHWSLCNGEVVPHAPRVETLVELSHRLSSGAAMALTAVLLVWAWRAHPKRHTVRGGRRRDGVHGGRGGFLVRGRAVDARTGKLEELKFSVQTQDAMQAFALLQAELAKSAKAHRSPRPRCRPSAHSPRRSSRTR
jgi:hypothetical protein